MWQVFLLFFFFLSPAIPFKGLGVLLGLDPDFFSPFKMFATDLEVAFTFNFFPNPASFLAVPSLSLTAALKSMDFYCLDWVFEPCLISLVHC